MIGQIDVSRSYIKDTYYLAAWNKFLLGTTRDMTVLFNKEHINKVKQKSLIQAIINYNTYLLGIDGTSDIFFPSEKLVHEKKEVMIHELRWAFWGNIADHLVDNVITIYIKNIKRAKKELENKIHTIDDVSISVETIHDNDTKKSLLKIMTEPYSNKFVISTSHYFRLVKMFIPRNDIRWVDIWICRLLLRYRYFTFMITGISLSVNIIYDFLREKQYGEITLEAFAGAVNSNMLHYCSLFYDIEKHFGSKGSFLKVWDSDSLCRYNIIVSNPPFINDIMAISANTLLNFLDHCDDICVVVTIPDWRSVTEYIDDIKLTNEDSSVQQDRPETSYMGYAPLRKSPYFRNIFSISKIFKYYNFFDDNNVNINTGTLILLLSKTPDNKYLNELNTFIKNKLN